MSIFQDPSRISMHFFLQQPSSSFNTRSWTRIRAMRSLYMLVVIIKISMGCTASGISSQSFRGKTDPGGHTPFSFLSILPMYPMGAAELIDPLSYLSRWRAVKELPPPLIRALHAKPLQLQSRYSVYRVKRPVISLGCKCFIHDDTSRMLTLTGEVLLETCCRCGPN